MIPTGIAGTRKGSLIERCVSPISIRASCPELRDASMHIPLTFLRKTHLSTAQTTCSNSRCTTHISAAAKFCEACGTRAHYGNTQTVTNSSSIENDVSQAGRDIVFVRPQGRQEMSRSPNTVFYSVYAASWRAIKGLNRRSENCWT